MRRPTARHSLFLLSLLFFAVCTQAQYHGDDIPGFLGMKSGTQAPPGLYVGNVVWLYPTNTIKDANGNTVDPQHRLHLTSTADFILVELVTNYNLFGAEVGFQAGIPFILRIGFNSIPST